MSANSPVHSPVEIEARKLVTNWPKTKVGTLYELLGPLAKAIAEQDQAEREDLERRFRHHAEHYTSGETVIKVAPQAPVLVSNSPDNPRKESGAWVTALIWVPEDSI